MRASIFMLIMLAFCVGCAESETDDGGSADAERVRTRTVCVAPDSREMAPLVVQAVDAWNDRSTDPLCTACADWDRCLCKAIAHELGHALGIRRHLREGMMHAEAIRSPTRGLTRRDVSALPENAPDLLFVDYGGECTTVIGWGYPAEAVYAGESAWYETKTRDIWIDPAKRWIY